ncbi:hypothetical protein SAMN05446037_104926 [Anaerovirgula multivorans]|uniref:Uncharacterized protein n=1 Tax=Anaerovirgula multivorans TaxID=312168 RepID=A0A239KM76_9FIRM|nr:hypothetical protein [Anaerovirgula multivorans]SNT18798.1 hypothetical protein SAMN05446037_104926 [Anaerovirgula multivorans]
MKYTNHLNLKKPESNDYFDQENHANHNMDVIDNVISGHLANSMPHRFINNGTVYKYGFSVVNGGLKFSYEEVSE